MFLIRYFNRFIIFTIVFCVMAAAALAWQIPASAAYICPSCFGFKQVDEQIYVEKSMKDWQVKRILRMVKASYKNVTKFYHSYDYKPVFLFCETKACDLRLGSKGESAVAHGYHFIRVTKLGTHETVLTHELSHIETHGRVGLIKLLQKKLPKWMDEGMAVIASNDTRYFNVNYRGDMSCITSGAHLEGYGEYYAYATCKTIKQAELLDENSALLELISRKNPR